MHGRLRLSTWVASTSRRSSALADHNSLPRPTIVAQAIDALLPRPLTMR